MYQKSGSIGEDKVELALRKMGLRIYARNWKVRTAEIDIVAYKKRTKEIYFVEVKYRRTFAQGAGFDYITPAKLSQMEYALQQFLWTENYFDSYSPRLAVASVSGEDGSVSFAEL